MKLMRELIRTEIAAVAGLVAAAVLFGLVGATEALMAPNSLIAPVSAACLVFIYTLAIGLLPATLFGAPTYAALRRSKTALTWPKVMVIGAIPGILALFYEFNLGLWAFFGGTITAVVTHAICSRQPSGTR